MVTPEFRLLTQLRHWRVAGMLFLRPFGSWESHRCQAAGRELRSMSTDPHTIDGSRQTRESTGKAHEGFGWTDRVRHGRRIGYRTGDRHRAVAGRGEGHALRYRGGGTGKGGIGLEAHER